MPTIGLIRKAGFPIAYVDRIGVSALCDPQKDWAALVALFPAQRMNFDVALNKVRKFFLIIQAPKIAQGFIFFYHIILYVPTEIIKVPKDHASSQESCIPLKIIPGPQNHAKIV